MNRKNLLLVIGLFFILILFSSCNFILPTRTPSASTSTVTPTSTKTPYVVCTPPPCDHEKEDYHCPDGEACIGGCGTTCATFTPAVQIIDTDPTSLISTPSPTVETVRFSVIGDFGLAGGHEAGVSNLVNSWEPDFIITVGDNNYPDGASETIDANIGQYYHDYIHPYIGEFGEGSDINRFFPTLGNHDLNTNQAQAYFDYFELPGNERYYDFVWGPVHFFALNSDSREVDGVGRSSEQAKWLQAQLEASTASWKIVYMHHPPFASTSSEPVDWIRWPFQEWGADIVFSGHDHFYERLEVDGFPYIVNGLGGGAIYAFGETHPGSQVRYNNDYGALFVEVSESNLTVVFEAITNEIIDDFQIEKKPEHEGATSSVQIFPNPEKYYWDKVVDGFTSPVGLTHPGDSSRRLFIIEQIGSIRVVLDGQLLSTPFLNIRDKLNLDHNEQGLLGLAFHPNYLENGYFYVNYTGENGDTFISRFQVSSDPNLADPNSETVLLRIEQPFGNHNGGQLVFGPGEYLYIGTGDGGSSNDPNGNGQNRNTLLGKILRLEVNYGDPYAVPSDNPYTNGGGRPEIWALGLRNPWRFSFDPLNGDLYIGDVGQNQWEEVDFLDANSPPGANFGWDYREGFHEVEGSPPENLALINPIWEYDHSQGCSITGGVVYRGSILDWQGVYLYGDFCSGRVWGLLRDTDGVWQNKLLFETEAKITSFGEDESGEIYLINRKGIIYRLTEK